MYKTIRHGENSLQYTILPQNDDFRIEGKCSPATGSGSGSGISASGVGNSNGNGMRNAANRRPKRRRSFFAYLGLIFVCTVIVGAILIPFLVSAECLPIPTEWLLKTKAAFASGVNINSEAKELRRPPVHGEGMNRNLVGHGINVGKTVKIINRGGTEKIILKVNKTIENATATNSVILPALLNPTNNLSDAGAALLATDKDNINTNHNNKGKDIVVQNVIEGKIETTASTVKEQAQSPQGEHFVAEIRFDDVGISTAVGGGINGAVPTIVVTTIRNSNGFSGNINEIAHQQNPKQQLSLSVSGGSDGNDGGNSVVLRPTPTPPTTTRIVTSNKIIVPSTSTTSRIMQVPLLKSTSKKPNIPPVLVTNQQTIATSTTTTPTTTATAITNIKANTNTNNNDISVTNKTLIVQSTSTVGRSPGNADWMQAHWPYIDPSTYFQWTGYKPEDSVLLPLLLGFALIGMILVIMVCLVARKRTIVSSVRKRNRNDIEDQGTEDNATLLAATNLSDDD